MLVALNTLSGISAEKSVLLINIGSISGSGLSQVGWHEEKDDPTPFIKYFLSTVISAYRDFGDRMEILSPSSGDTVRKAVESKIGKFTKREIVELCPNLSTSTVERHLRSMVEAGELTKQGQGKNTVYVKSS